MARINPISIKDWPREMRAALVAMVPPEPRHPQPTTKDGRSKGLNMLGIFAHHPMLARAFFAFNGQMIMGTTLTLRQREILVLRVAALRKASYEWAQHIAMARDAGLTDEEIGRIAWGPDAPYWDPLEAALIRAVDELIGEGLIDDNTWSVLTENLDTQQILDVIFTVGAYETLAFMLRSCAPDFDDDLRAT